MPAKPVIAVKDASAKTMDAIMEKNGPKDVRKTTRSAVRMAHAKLNRTPREADKYLQIISLLWNYASRKLDWPIGENPASGIKRYGKQREFEPWPAWMVAQLESAPATVRSAAMLILGTLQRPNAAMSMRYGQFDGEWMFVYDEQGKKWREVYCPDDLRDYLSELPRNGIHVLPRTRRQRSGTGELRAPSGPGEKP